MYKKWRVYQPHTSLKRSTSLHVCTSMHSATYVESTSLYPYGWTKESASLIQPIWGLRASNIQVYAFHIMHGVYKPVSFHLWQMRCLPAIYSAWEVYKPPCMCKYNIHSTTYMESTGLYPCWGTKESARLIQTRRGLQASIWEQVYIPQQSWSLQASIHVPQIRSLPTLYSPD